jgi:hypothetical protein
VSFNKDNLLTFIIVVLAWNFSLLLYVQGKCFWTVPTITNK